MNEIDVNAVKCPGCQGPLRARVMACDACGVNVEGPFTPGVWAKLSSRQLHFIQLFVHCEGNIRDMEKALGVSYPTVKAQLAEINARLGEPRREESQPGADKSARRLRKRDVAGVLAGLQDGVLTYDEALNLIRQQGVKNAR